MGPHPFPTMVRDFQSVIGMEIKEQMHRLTGKLPDAIIGMLLAEGVMLLDYFIPLLMRRKSN